MSASGDVLAAVVGLIQGLPLSPRPAGVRPRKQIRLADGDGPGPLVLVAQGEGEEFEPLASGSTRGTVLWLVRYPVSVAGVFRNGGRLGDNPDLRAWWDVLWPALADARRLLAELPRVNQVIPRGKSQFDPGALDKALDAGVKSFVVEMLEDR